MGFIMRVDCKFIKVVVARRFTAHSGRFYVQMTDTQRMPKYVLDTSALLSGREFPDGELYVPSAVTEEMRPGGRMRRKMELHLEVRIKIMEPTPESVAVVKEKARETGDAGRISNTDAQVLALALDLGAEAVVLTDDYSIQNLAKALGAKYHSMQTSGIKSVFQWEYVCAGCRRKYDAPREICPECGSEVRTRRRKDEAKAALNDKRKSPIVRDFQSRTCAVEDSALAAEKEEGVAAAERNAAVGAESGTNGEKKREASGGAE